MRNLLLTSKGIWKQPIIYTEVDGQGSFVSPGSSVTNRIYKALPIILWDVTISIDWNFQFVLQYKQSWAWYFVGSWTTRENYTLESGREYWITIRYADDSSISPTDFVNWNGRIIIEQ